MKWTEYFSNLRQIEQDRRYISQIDTLMGIP